MNKNKKILFTVAVTMTAVFTAWLVMGFDMLKAAGDDKSCETTILFTHDTHSHVLSSTDKDGKRYGGYAKLYTALKAYRAEYKDSAVLTLDAGDFSMGTLFQTLYTTDAAELRLLGKMGFDVTTLGNHEYDYRDKGLAEMLNAAMASGESLPEIVIANYYPPTEGDEGYTEGSKAVWDAFAAYGVKEYTMIERNGIRYAVFGLFGEDSHEYSPMSGMVWEDYIEGAERVVAQIKANEDYDYIICLSHCGTTGAEEDESKSEDHRLANKVEGIDIIISGHSHTTYREPVIVNDTIIVSVGSNAKNLGVLRIAKDDVGKTKVLDYDIVYLQEENFEDSKVILHEANKYKEILAESYLAGYGMEYDQILAYSDFDFKAKSNNQEELPLGNLIADSYIYAVKQAEGSDYVKVDFAVVANGVIRKTFKKGNITVADAFDVSSLGVGADGTPGYPLVAVYLTGSELKDVFELDASVTPLMDVAQLHGSGASWTYNTKRIIFNKVTDCYILDEDGTKQDIEDDKLYRVVTGLYSGQMLGSVKAQSFGILSITPRDKDGKPITNLEDYIIYDENGNEVKEWYALASYLDSFEEENGVSVIPADKYKEAEGRKNVYASFNIVELLKSPNWITITVISIVVIIIAVIVFCVIYHKKRKRHKRLYRKTML